MSPHHVGVRTVEGRRTERHREAPTSDLTVPRTRDVLPMLSLPA